MSQNSSESASFQNLLNRLNAGEGDVRQELISVAESRLLILTRRMLRRYPDLKRWEQTDDVFQNAMVKFHRALEAVQPDSPQRFFGLAVTQIRRSLIDLARHHFGPHGQAAHHETDLAKGQSQHGDKTRAAIGDDGPETAEAWSAFHQTVDKLPEEERDVFQLIWYGGLEQAAAAEVLGVSLSTVQRRWYRARHLLAESLAPFASTIDRAETHD